MPQPTPYERLYSLTGYAEDNPANPYNAAQHDAEFDAVKENLDGLNSNIAIIQRDDGMLKNGIVTPRSLSTATLNMIANWNVRGEWAAFTDYAVNDFVEFNGIGYLCLTAHTSTDFATQLALGYWLSIDVSMAALADTSDIGNGDALIGVKKNSPGSVGRTQHDVNEEINSVESYGASTSASAAENTVAFNTALSSHSVVFVPGDQGDIYDLNELDAWTAGKILYGKATLRFNTTADCISLSNPTSTQTSRVRIEGFHFDNLTNVPASFIKNGGFLNVVLDDLHFVNCAATRCIDNVKGYGMKIRDSVLTNVTGSGMRFRDDGAVSEYSYIASIIGTDITNISGDGIELEGCAIFQYQDGVIEGCGGKGIKAGTAGGSIQAWNINLTNVWFENNVGTDIDLQSDSNHWCTATLTNCAFLGVPTIALGSKSKITVIGINSGGGGHTCTISGSGSATATLINAPNYAQSGTFNWVEIDDNSTTVPKSYTPSWTAASVNPSLGDGTLTGKYTRIGNRVDINIHLVIGSTTNTGTGKWFLTLPFNPTATSYGVAYMSDFGNTDWSGIVYAATNGLVQVGMTSGGTANNGNGRVAPAVPFTWAVGDILDINISIWV